MNTFIRLFKDLSEETNLETLRLKFLVSIVEIQNVHRGSIWLKTDKGYECVEAIGNERELIKGICLDFNEQSIVGWVIERGEMKISIPKEDGLANKEIESKLKEQNTMILCFPLYSRDGTVYGALEILDSSPEGKCINLEPEHLDLIKDIIDTGSVAMSNASIYQQQKNDIAYLLNQIEDIREKDILLFHSKSLKKIISQVETYSIMNSSIFISGEAHTGKQIFAKFIHENSSRKKVPFMAIDCSKIPTPILVDELFGNSIDIGLKKDYKNIGIFEKNNGGTVYLKKIEYIPLNLQKELLHLIQTGNIKSCKNKPIDVRIIASTEIDIEKKISKGSFDKKLYERLSVLKISLPTLSQRKEDLPLLIKHFIHKGSLLMNIPVKKISIDAIMLMLSYKWPGNLYELETSINFLLATVDSDYITAKDVIRLKNVDELKNNNDEPNFKNYIYPKHAEIPFGSYTWEELERDYVLYLLDKNGSNISKAALDAGLNRSTFVSRMKKLGLHNLSEMNITMLN